MRQLNKNATLITLYSNSWDTTKVYFTWYKHSDKDWSLSQFMIRINVQLTAVFSKILNIPDWRNDSPIHDEICFQVSFLAAVISRDVLLLS